MTQVASETLLVFLQSGGSYKTTAERLMLREVTPAATALARPAVTFPERCGRSVRFVGVVRPRANAVSAGQPGAQVRPVSRADLPALHLPGNGVEVVDLIRYAAAATLLRPTADGSPSAAAIRVPILS